MNGLHFKIGSTCQDWEVFLGDRDITSELMVRSLKFTMNADSGFTVVELEAYADSLDILPGDTHITHVEMPPLSLRLQAKAFFRELLRYLGFTK